MIKQRILKDNT